MQRTVYVVDTSTWIRMVKLYPNDVFPGLARRCEELIRDRRMLSPNTVLDEIEAGNDAVVAWANDHIKAFVPNTGPTITRMENILHDYPFLGGSADNPSRADSNLIALALSIGEGVDDGAIPVIVTEERQDSGKKIPHVARECGIDSCSTLGMFRREGWAF